MKKYPTQGGEPFFKNLPITGDPFGDRPGNGVSLDEAHRYEKIVGAIDPTEWETLLEREFGISIDGVTAL
ncbi:hypothetical protein [Haladaptatus sp. YSMS36]|uniref:hypothetical protein n=1 Tax=Haladaptatus sp. YSMS36 TaxID=3033384 RepID=UPI0023E81A7B|nr:hypothetical protein [Haladaptatus sp. YSMS36]